MAQKLPIVIDFHNVEKIQESHLGEAYTTLITKNRERITVNMTLQECKARFFRTKWDDVEEE